MRLVIRLNSQITPQAISWITSKYFLIFESEPVPDNDLCLDFYQSNSRLYNSLTPLHLVYTYNQQVVSSHFYRSSKEEEEGENNGTNCLLSRLCWSISTIHFTILREQRVELTKTFFEGTKGNSTRWQPANSEQWMDRWWCFEIRSVTVAVVGSKSKIIIIIE